MEWLKSVPVLGALAGDGVKSSEGVGFAGIIALVAAHASTMTLPLGIALAGLAVGLGIYANARSRVKEVEAKEGA